jgi:hypothetical protein
MLLVLMSSTRRRVVAEGVLISLCIFVLLYVHRNYHSAVSYRFVIPRFDNEQRVLAIEGVWPLDEQLDLSLTITTLRSRPTANGTCSKKKSNYYSHIHTNINNGGARKTRAKNALRSRGRFV